MLIRRCDFGDERELRAVHALQRGAYETEAAMIGTRAMPGLRESVAELAASGETFWGAFADEVGAGDSGCVGVIATEPEAWDGPGRGAVGRLVRVSRLAVRPDWFGRGVGGRLVRHVVGATRGSAGEAVVLKVTTGAANAPARRVYEREGFVLSGEYGASDGTPIVEYRYGWNGAGVCAR